MTRLRNRHFLLADLLLLSCAAYLSFVLRLDRFALGSYLGPFLTMLGFTVLLTPATFFGLGVYSRHWRYAMAEDAPLLVGAVLLLTVAVAAGQVLATHLIPDLRFPPRSVPGLFFLLALVATAGPRLIVRLWFGTAFRVRRGGEPVLIIGAGHAGAMTVRELRRNAALGLRVIGFLDDDPAKRRAHIGGVPVLGDRGALPHVIAKHNVRRVVIAMPSAPGPVIREVVHLCQDAGIQPQTVPGLYEILGGRVSVSQLRDIQIEDLLRRAPICTDLADVTALLKGKRVLVTGAGGSIGSEICHQVLLCQPDEIVMLGHGENSIFAIQNELLRLLGQPVEGRGEKPTKLHAVIADIRFPQQLSAVFAQHSPQVVFHAAAHKHVPLMEANAAEAISNNVVGTQNVVAAAIAAGVERFVLISSDKAVNPTNVMGASKRAAELVVHSAAEASGRPYMVVRFGNVLGSRGSVVPTMRDQISRGGPVTVTHPSITRYFMTVPEAVQLVLQAVTLGQRGEVFVFDMGQPVRILDLARDLISLSGLEPDRDIQIVFTGLRPGEKLFEELFIFGEDYERTRHPEIFIAANAGSSIPDNLERALSDLASAADRRDDRAAIAGLAALVPEFHQRVNDRTACEITTCGADLIGTDSVRHVGSATTKVVD